MFVNRKEYEALLKENKELKKSVEIYEAQAKVLTTEICGRRAQLMDLSKRYREYGKLIAVIRINADLISDRSNSRAVHAIKNLVKGWEYTPIRKFTVRVPEKVEKDDSCLVDDHEVSVDSKRETKEEATTGEE